MIDGEEVIKFYGSDVIVNGEAVSNVVSSAALAECEVVSENVVPTSAEVNGESLGVTFDGTVPLVDGHPVIATTEGLTVEIKQRI